MFTLTAFIIRVKKFCELKGNKKKEIEFIPLHLYEYYICKIKIITVKEEKNI